MSPKPITITTGRNAYAETVQGLVNQPPTVVRLIENAARRHDIKIAIPEQAEVYDRLRSNAPRVAIIGGSTDHLAHITDEQSIAGAVLAVWQAGGVPFSFGIPVVCDGAAQSHLGMCYSLYSRNLAAEFVANQIEAHAYHAAIVLQGCDKTPFGIACGLSAVDRVRKRRGDAPLWATFVPGHVLKGGSLPENTRSALETVAARAEKAGMHDDADDLRQAMEYVIQCTSTEAHVGILQRLTRAGVIKEAEAKDLQRQISTCACHADGGICAFNGTGNSSRICTAALGLVHPAVELLSRPPSVELFGKVVDGLFSVLNDPEASVSAVVRRNWANAVRVHSATGGSTNLVLHFLALANYAGIKTTVADYDNARREKPVPDILNFSLTEDRTHYELAQQVERGEIRGMDTIYHELQRLNVPLDLDATTMAGKSWRKRLTIKKGLAAKNVKSPAIVLDTPRRPLSGVDVLRGNFFDSAVLKMSGMADEQLETFDDKIHCVVYMDNEEAANEALLDPAIVSKLPGLTKLSKPVLLAMLRYNAAGADEEIAAFSRLGKDELYDAMVASGHIKFALIIAGQGPDAFGMPEMFTPMQHINSNRRLRKITTLMSDGRYSGVSYGAAIGHMTPEVSCGGGIGYLQSGDLLRLCLKARTLDLIDTDALKAGKVQLLKSFKKGTREALAKRRIKNIEKRRQQIARLCIQDVTSADTGVIPKRVYDDAQ